jgi:hypothetical protein
MARSDSVVGSVDATAVDGARVDATAVHGARVDAMAVDGAKGHGMSGVRDVTGGMLVIDNAMINVSPELKAAILHTARLAFKNMVLHTHMQSHADHLSVRLRHMVLSRTPETSTPSESGRMHLDHVTGDATGGRRGAAPSESRGMLLGDGRPPKAVLGGTFARMVVQIPSEYTAGEQGSVSVCYNGNGNRNANSNGNGNGNVRALKLETNSQEVFHYVMAHKDCSMHIHTPSRGCAALLVYDVSCALPFPPQYELADRQTAEVLLEESVKYWEADPYCDKLAFVLNSDRSVVASDSEFDVQRVRDDEDRTLIQALMSCERLDVGLAGAFVV